MKYAVALAILTGLFLSTVRVTTFDMPVGPKYVSVYSLAVPSVTLTFQAKRA